MKVEMFAIVALALFLFLNFLVIPTLRKPALARNDKSLMRRVVFLNICECLHTITLMLFLSAGAVFLYLAYMKSRGGESIEELGRNLEFLRESVDSLLVISPGISVATLAVLAFAMIWMSYKKGKAKTSQAFDRARELEFQRIVRMWEADELEELEPTRQMLEIAAMIQQDHQNIEQLTEALNEANPDTTAEIDKAIESLSERIADLTRIYHQIDIARRMEVKVSTSEFEVPPPVGLQEKVLTFFVSKGLVNTLGRAQKVTFVLLALLLIPAMLAVSSTSVKQELQEHELVIEDLYLGMSLAEAEQSWSTQPSSQTNSLTDEDEEILDILAENYEESVATTAASLIQLAPGGAQALRNLSVRRAVLNNFAANAANRSAGASIRSGGNQGVDSLLDITEHKQTRRGPATELGRQFREDVRRKVASSSPSRWSRIKATVRADSAAFQRVASQADARALLAANSSSFQGSYSGGHTNVDQFRSGIADALPPDSRSRVYNVQSNRFLSSVENGTPPSRLANQGLGTHPPPFARAEVARMRTVAQRHMSTSNFDADLRAHTPSILPNAEAHVDYTRAQQASRRLGGVNQRTGRMGATFGDSLASFDDYFPGRQGAEFETQRSSARQNFELDKDARNSASRSKSSHRMARSMTRLRGFRRIGGVLIGYDLPEDSPSIDVADITWSDDGNFLALQAKMGTGQTINLGTFPNEMVHLALGYVADGRPVTATMTTAEPLKELRILLHPVLVDTHLGCSAVDLDRFVDEYTTEYTDLGTAREKATQDAYNDLILYRLAWAARYTQAFKSPSLKYEIGDPSGTFLESLFYSAQEILTDAIQEDQDLIDQIDPERFRPGSPHLVPTKAEYFDTSLTRQIHSCLTATPSPENSIQFRDCIEKTTIFTNLSPGDSQALSWAAPPPQFEPWSGVREKSYTLDSSLEFVTGSASNDSDLWPFDFVVQLSFVTAPYFLKISDYWYSDENGELDSYSDESPWTFPSTAPIITRYVAQGLKQNDDDNRIYQEMKEFTRLQRFFRNALNGKFGDSFPIEKLTELSALTGPFVRSNIRTARWNARPGQLELELLGVLYNEEVMALLNSSGFDYVANMAAACRARLSDHGIDLESDLSRMSMLILSSLPTDQWNEGCDFQALLDEYPQIAMDSPNPNQQLAYNVVLSGIEVGHAREIREALGVLKDDLQGSTCAVIEN